MSESNKKDKGNSGSTHTHPQWWGSHIRLGDNQGHKENQCTDQFLSDGSDRRQRLPCPASCSSISRRFLSKVSHKLGKVDGIRFSNCTAVSFPKREITLFQIKICIQTGSVLHLDPRIAGKPQGELAPPRGPSVIIDRYFLRQ